MVHHQQRRLAKTDNLIDRCLSSVDRHDQSSNRTAPVLDLETIDRPRLVGHLRDPKVAVEIGRDVSDGDARHGYDVGGGNGDNVPAAIESRAAATRALSSGLSKLSRAGFGA